MLVLLTLLTATLVLSSLKELHGFHLEYAERPIASKLIPATRIERFRILKEGHVIESENTIAEQSKVFHVNQINLTVLIN